MRVSAFIRASTSLLLTSKIAMKVVCVALLIALAVVSAQATQSVNKLDCVMCDFLVNSVYSSNMESDYATALGAASQCRMFGEKQADVRSARKAYGASSTFRSTFISSY